MSTILTETSTFTATVTAPDDGDPATGAAVTTGLQSLTNRTKYLNDTVYELGKLVLHAEFQPSGAWTTASKLGLTISFNTTYDGETYAVSSGDITVPYAGRYLVSGHLYGVDITPNPLAAPVVRVNTTSNINMFVNADVTGDPIAVYRDAHFEGAVNISDPATDKINIYNGDANDIDLASGSARLNIITVRYLGPL
jgi:hypothetical protein